MSTSPHFLSGRHIVVAGAGIAGLSFAVALRKLWPTDVPPPRITIFDRDSKHDALGREGYSLSLAGSNNTGGLVALKDLGVLDRILSHAILSADKTGAFRLWDADWSEILSVRLHPAPGLPTSGIRIARKHLRETLVEAVADEIQWGAACVSATKLEDAKMLVQVSRSDGSQLSAVECDLLVVADGANSKIRAGLRPDDVLRYAGAVQIAGLARFTGGIPAPLDKSWGQQLSDGRGVACFYSPVDQQSVVWALSFLEPTARARTKTSDSQEGESLVQEALTRGHVLGELFQTIVSSATNPRDVFCLPARDKKPFRHDPELGPVVFIGDSNHAVSPFAGYGANLALKDGWDLAQKLTAATSVKDAVREYDAVSFPRAVDILKTSRSRIKWGHSTGWMFSLWRGFMKCMGYILWLTGRA
jgi:2-polyprenyl-6-methoxyphenol hydroxylase-like FAD-dependent oxidoreductase